MKTRNGFVSNSSSSSFIILLPEVPKNVEDLEKMLFDENHKNVSYEFDKRRKVSPKVASEKVFNQISSGKASLSDLTEEFESLAYEKMPNENYGKIQKMTNEEREKYYNERDEKINEIARELAYKFLTKKDHEGKHPFIVSFDDSDEPELERGDTFKKVPHLRISHH